MPSGTERVPQAPLPDALAQQARLTEAPAVPASGGPPSAGTRAQPGGAGLAAPRRRVGRCLRDARWQVAPESSGPTPAGRLEARHQDAPKSVGSPARLRQPAVVVHSPGATPEGLPPALCVREPWVRLSAVGPHPAPRRPPWPRSPSPRLPSAIRPAKRRPPGLGRESPRHTRCSARGSPRPALSPDRRGIPSHMSDSARSSWTTSHRYGLASRRRSTTNTEPGSVFA